jgi:protein subunit release factor B
MLTRIYFWQQPSFLMRISSMRINAPECIAISVYNKHTLDYSRVPKLKEEELDERFVRGSGPGGQAVNKTNNCVLLIHKPTGTVISVKVSTQNTFSQRYKPPPPTHMCTQSHTHHLSKNN